MARFYLKHGHVMLPHAACVDDGIEVSSIDRYCLQVVSANMKRRHGSRVDEGVGSAAQQQGRAG